MKIKMLEEKPPMGSKRLRTLKTDKNSSKRLKKQLDNDENDDNQLSDKEILNESIDFCMPKPGPHAKAGEWRKWKQMKRKIRQTREEKRLIKKEQQSNETDFLNESKKSKQTKGRDFTLSIAIPSSIMTKVQSKELKTYFVGQIARAAVLFCVDEIVVYNEYSVENNIQSENTEQLIKILEYLECPQYLRKSLFPPHKHLEHAGLLNPLDAPHHFKLNDKWLYREGVVTDIPSKDNKGSWVDIGLLNKIQVDKKIAPGIRVTVKKKDQDSKKLSGIVVSPQTPRIENGIYWGYIVRHAKAFKQLIHESSFKEKYDLKIAVNCNNRMNFESLNSIPKAKHVLIVFGGLGGIEAAIEADEKLKVSRIEQVFDFVCESKNQVECNFGSRSVRLEESILICLSLLKIKLNEANTYCVNLNDQINSEIRSAECKVEENQH